MWDQVAVGQQSEETLPSTLTPPSALIGNIPHQQRDFPPAFSRLFPESPPREAGEKLGTGAKKTKQQSEASAIMTN